MNPTYRQLIVLALGIYAALTVVIRLLPDRLLDWALFCLLCIVFVTEGIVMNYRAAWRQSLRAAIAVIISVRYVLGAYFLFAAARVVFDPDRTWPDWVLYQVRAFVVTWAILELLVIPYRRQTSGVVDLLTDDPPKETRI